MDTSQVSSTNFHEAEKELSHELKELISSLPRTEGWRPQNPFYLYHGFWYPASYIQSTMALHRHYRARPSDIILATTPKSGTTWLKALAYAVVNRTRYAIPQHPLLNTNPHDLVPFFEVKLYARSQVSDLSKLPSPRIFATHIPYTSLPESLIESNCRIVYLCRDPKDSLISMWHFANNKGREESLSLEEAFEKFCNGVSLNGPFWDHVLGYWKASLERPKRVLFLKYEGMKQEPEFHLKRLAEFLDYPFSSEEGKEGVVEAISKLCSFKNLSNLEVNKSGKLEGGDETEKRIFFRKVEMGDWVNYLSSEMIERLDHITEQRLQGSGLTFSL